MKLHFFYAQYRKNYEIENIYMINQDLIHNFLY